MKSLLRILIVWLTLLAVPYQGFAATAALGCAHGTPANPAATVHHAPSASGAPAHACHENADASAHQHHLKCGNCAACCSGAAMAPPLAFLSSPPGETCAHIVTDAGHVPSVYPDYPERPPRFARA